MVKLNWQELEHKYYIKTFKRLPVTLVRGQGARAWDDKGKEYLDFVAGWAVNSLGHCPPVLIKAIEEQARTLIQTSNNFYTMPQLKLAELLVKHSCLDRVFFCNSGAEANEGAVKLARRYGKLHRNGAYEVITTINSFHGRTLAMVAATGQHKYQEPFEPIPSGFVNVPYNDVQAIKDATSEKTCAVLLEPVQGEGGVIVPDAGYLPQVQAWCRQKGILFMLDEIQTGIGRLGTLFGYESFGVEPDVITLAKGLGSGVPIGAFMAKEAAASALGPGEHGSTFGGNPLACAAGYAALNYIIEKDVSAQAKRTGDYLKGRLDALKGNFELIADVRGRGLLLAVEFRKDIAQAVLLACIEEGLLLNAVKPNALRLMPPLIITQQDADEAVAKLQRALHKVASQG